MASKNIPYSKVYLYELLYNASKGIGDHQGALYYYEKLAQAEKTLFNDNQKSKIFQLQLHNEVEKKDQKILEQQLKIAKNRKKSILLFALNGFLILSAAGIWFIFKLMQNYRRKIYEKGKQLDDILDDKYNSHTQSSSESLISSLSVVEENASYTFAEAEFPHFFEEQRKALYHEMLQVIEKQKLYLNPDLNKKVIISILGTNRQY